MLTSLLWYVLNVGFKKWLSPTWQVSLTWVALIIQPRLPQQHVWLKYHTIISHHYNPLKKRLWAFKQPYVDGFSSIFQQVHPISSMFDLLPKRLRTARQAQREFHFPWGCAHLSRHAESQGYAPKKGEGPSGPRFFFLFKPVIMGR